MPSPSPLLEAVDLTCERDGRLLFEALSVRLCPGELLHVTGPNGSGKTSLLRILAGLLPSEAGRIERLSGDEVLWLGHAPGIASGLTARENLRGLAALRRSAAPAELERALATVGLAGYDDTLCLNLSAGQRRRVALARLYLPSPPRLWLLDEPFTALDQAAAERLERRLHTHCTGGGGVVLTSHQRLALEPAGYRVLALDAMA